MAAEMNHMTRAQERERKSAQEKLIGTASFVLTSGTFITVDEELPPERQQSFDGQIRQVDTGWDVGKQLWRKIRIVQGSTTGQEVVAHESEEQTIMLVTAVTALAIRVYKRSQIILSPEEAAILSEEALITAFKKIQAVREENGQRNKLLRRNAAIVHEEQPTIETLSESIPEADLLPEIEVDSTDRRVYHGIFKGGTPGNYLLARDLPPKPPYSSDYYDNGRSKELVNPYVVLRTINGAVIPNTLKGKDVIVRGETFEDEPLINVDGRAKKITKLEAYSVSTLPIQSEQREQIIRLVKKFRLTSVQIAPKLHMPITEVEAHIAAINEACYLVTGQREKKFLE